MTATADDLLDALVARPDDRELFGIYADALLLAGDPRGELVSVQIAREAADDVGLAERERELIVRDVGPALDARLGGTPRKSYVWRRGFVDTLMLDHHADEPFDVLPALAREPAARLLRRLRVLAVRRWGRGDLEPVFAQLAQLADSFPHLAAIEVVEGWGSGEAFVEGPIRIGDLSPIYAAYPRLEELDLEGIAMAFGAIDLPALRRFRATNLVEEQVSAFERARWPSLVELDLHFETHFRAAAAVEALLASSVRVPELSLSGPPDAMARAAEVLPDSAVGGSLRRLRLGRGHLKRVLVDALVANADGLARLEQLRIHRGQIDVPDLARLRAALGATLVVLDV